MSGKLETTFGFGSVFSVGGENLFGIVFDLAPDNAEKNFSLKLKGFFVIFHG